MRTSTEAIVPTAITTNRKEPERTMNKEYKTFSSRASAREFIEGNNLHNQWIKISAAEYRGGEESLKIIRRRDGYVIKRISDWVVNPIMICAGAENGGLTWYIDR